MSPSVGCRACALGLATTTGQCYVYAHNRLNRLFSHITLFIGRIHRRRSLATRTWIVVTRLTAPGGTAARARSSWGAYVSCTVQRPVFAHSLGGAGRRETPARISMHDLCPVLEAPWSLWAVGVGPMVGPPGKDLRLWFLTPHRKAAG